MKQKVLIKKTFR